MFISEPENVTVYEGESTRMNCTTSMNTDVVFWRINGTDYRWDEFDDIDDYTYDIFDNSLTINSSPRRLSGTSFQCLLHHQIPSAIGYLTVISPTQTIVTPVAQSTPLLSTSK